MKKRLPLIFFSAPHRVMFFAGAVQILLTMLLWALELASRHLGIPVSITVNGLPPAWFHALSAQFGFFPFFIFGFLMTALPRWIGANALKPVEYLSAFFLMGTGWLFFYLGIIFIGNQSVYCLLITATGWLWGVFVLARVTYQQKNADRTHAWIACAALFIGIFAFTSLILNLAQLNATGVQTSIELAIWGFLLPIFFNVSHRMLPFFTQSALPNYTIWRPMPVLWLVLACFGAHFIINWLAQPRWLFLPDALACILVMICLYQWKFWRSFQLPMLAMLHLSTVWLTLGLAFFTLQDLSTNAFGGLAPLHLLTIGYMSSLLLAMVTRVTRGHSGYAIYEDKIAWPLFWLLQTIVLLRTIGEFFDRTALWNPLFIAIIIWLAVFGSWAYVYLPLYWRARIDGKPG